MTQIADTSETTVAPIAAEKSLYERLGGYDAICAATDDLLSRLMNDPQLKNYWKGISHDSRRKARQHIVDFMTEAAGGPALYLGRDMKTSHAGMEISNSDWDVFMYHANATLDHFQVPSREREDILNFFGKLKVEIVEKT